MKHSLPFPAILLPLMFFILAGTPTAPADNLPPVHKIRIFFSGNVQAELGPCG